MANRTPPNLWEKGKSGNPKGYTREMRQLKLEREVQFNEYVNAARKAVPVEDFEKMVAKVSQQVKTRGDVKAFEVICKLLMHDMPKAPLGGGNKSLPNIITATLERVFSEDTVDGEIKELDSGESTGSET